MFFSLDIFCEFFLMDGLEHKTFSLMEYHQYGFLFLFRTYGKLREYKNTSQEAFANKIVFLYIYIHVLE